MEASWGTENLQRAILLRLPLPALFRMKCVCKEWNGLISEPSFASDYIGRSPPRLAGYFVRVKQLGFVPASEAFRNPDPLHDFGGGTDHDAFPSFTASTVVASSGGLLLCSCKDHCYVVCEPLTRRWRALPTPPSLDLPASWVIGFIHRIDLPPRRDSPPRRSYKVVRLFYHGDTAMAVETFSSDSGEWETSVVASHLPFSTFGRWTGDNTAVAVGGAPHWLDGDLNLVAYDVDEGNLRLAEPPPRTAADGLVHALGDAGGRLGYCCKDAAGFDVWVLVGDQDVGGGGGRRWEHQHRVESSSTIRGEDVRKNSWDRYDMHVAVFGGPYRAFKCDLQGGRGTGKLGAVIPSIWYRRRRPVPYTWPSWCFDLYRERARAR